MCLKVALCFILNYDHILIKEDIWRKWIESNKDIINVYFFYKDITKIKSDWIKEHLIPSKYIIDTSYLYVMPAYIALMRYALKADNNANEWVIFLTDFCVPLISPIRFRHLFYQHYYRSIIKWRYCWWNVETNARANLKYLPENFHLANSPWLTITRKHAELVLRFINEYPKMALTVFNGIIANESFFAIALEKYGALKNKLGVPNQNILCINSHIADWDRMSSATSPHIFAVESNKKDRVFIETNLAENPFAMFMRKIAPEYPDKVIEHYIYEWNGENDKKIVIKKPIIFNVPIWLYRLINHKYVYWLYSKQTFVITMFMILLVSGSIRYFS